MKQSAHKASSAHNDLDQAHVQLLSDLLAASSVDEVMDQLTWAARGVGFADVSYLNGDVGELFGAPGGAVVKSVRHYSSCDGDWMENLSAEYGVEKDYDIQLMLSGARSPFMSGANILEIMGSFTSEQRSILQHKAEHGFGANFIVPLAATPLGLQRYGAVMFISNLDVADYVRVITRSGNLLVSLAHCAQHLIQVFDRDRVEDSAVEVRVGEGGPAALENAGGPLTPRQLDVVAALARGRRAEEIADELNLSRVTVDRHLRAARTALSARTSGELVALCVARGLVAPDSSG